MIAALFVALALRMLLYSGIQPNHFPDTDSYDRGALAIMKGGSLWESYPRTPVYPAFLAGIYALAGQKNYKAVIIAQLFVLGLANTAIIYLLAMRIFSEKWFASLTAIFFNMDLMPIIFDFAILTESISAFLLLCSIWLLIRAIEKFSWQRTILAGLFLGIAALVRPAFAPLLPFVFIFFFLGIIFIEKNRGDNSQRSISPKVKVILLHSFVFLLLSSIPCFVWLNGNRARGKGFSFSPFMLNAGLTNHVGWFFAKLPDEYAPVRDPYLRQLKDRQTAVGGYYRASAKMMEGARKLGVNTERAFEKLVTRLCLRLIKENPGLYLKTFWMAWDFMWGERPLIYFQPENPNKPGGNFSRIKSKFFWGFWFNSIEAGILQKPLWGKWQFKIFLIMSALLITLLRKKPEQFATVILAFSIVMVLAITTNALELSENARYRAPFQPIVFLVCFSGMLHALYFIWGRFWAKSKEIPCHDVMKKRKKR